MLGEFIRVPDEAEATATEYEHALDAIAAEQLDANVSVKLSALGIEIDRDLVERTLARVLATAERHGIFVRIDMEHSGLTDATLDIYREPARGRARRRRHRHPGLHAPRRRRHGRAAPTCSRACAWSRASTSSREDDRLPGACPRSTRNYLRLLEQLVDQGSYVAHRHARPRAGRGRARPDRAARPRARPRTSSRCCSAWRATSRRRLIADGHRLRVYVPYGRAWYAYSVRRLKENPSIAGYVARDVVRTIVPGLR